MPKAHSPGPRRVLLTRLLLAGGALALVWSAQLPYWGMRVAAPQYPKGLTLTVYVNRLEGDVREIDNLNHYIGMRPLARGAALERRLALPAIGLALVGLLGAALLKPRWAGLFALPTVLIPLLFPLDLYCWMRDYGLNLDPHAPLNRSVKPFIPTILGQGKIAQFSVEAWFDTGFGLAVLAGVLALLGCWFRVGSRRQRLTPVWALAALCAGAAPLDAATLRVGQDQPQASITAALAVAAPGDTIVVHGGTHPGSLVVDKSVALIGEGRPVIDGGGRGTVVRITAPEVTIRGFLIRHSGDTLAAGDAGVLVAAARATIEDNVLEDVLFGIALRRAPGTVVRQNRLSSKALAVPRRGDLIRVWYSDDVRIEHNATVDGRDVVFWYSHRLTVQGNTVQRGRYGLHFMYCNEAVVADNRLTQNSVGAYLMYSTALRLIGNRLVGNRGPSGYGLGLKDMAATVIEANTIADNRVGIFLEHSTGRYTGNVVAYNDVGVRLFPSAVRNVLTANSFIENADQIVVEGLAHAPTNTWTGNYWSDYRGYDANGDGTGDVPYEAVQLFEELRTRFPALQLYADSPAQQALELAARLFPIFAPHAELVDAAPRMAPGAAGGRP